MAKHPTRYYVDKARKAGIDVEYGSKHIKFRGTTLEGKRSTMMVPHTLKGNGTEHAIVKWLKMMGVFAVLAAILMILF